MWHYRCAKDTACLVETADVLAIDVGASHDIRTLRIAQWRKKEEIHGILHQRKYP